MSTVRTQRMRYYLLSATSRRLRRWAFIVNKARRPKAALSGSLDSVTKSRTHATLSTIATRRSARDSARLPLVVSFEEHPRPYRMKNVQ